MKKPLLFVAALFALSVVNSQCVNDFDWGETEYGVSPDPDQGETFIDGEINVSYTDFIHVKVPTNASAVVEGVDLPIDSVRLDNVTLAQNGVTYSQTEFGIELLCNNDGTSSNPCTFMGGQEACGTLTGTPLLGGTFDVVIEATIFVTFFGVQEYPFNYEGYSLLIVDPNNIEENTNPVVDVKVSPNPFTTNANLEFSAQNGGEVKFKLYTLLGEEKYSEVINAKKGVNTMKLNSDELDSGIYLYHLEMGDFRITKRLVISK